MEEAAGHVLRNRPAGHGRLRRALPVRRRPRLRQRHGGAAEQRLQVQRRHRSSPDRQGCQPPDRRPGRGAEEGPARLRRRREQDLLQGPGRRPEGHHARCAQHAQRQGQAGWLDHHPAVREELLPHAGPHREPQAQGAGDLAQDRPADVQGPDPRRVHQHRLLRPRRRRHPGRRPGVLRHRRQGPERLPGRLPRLPPPGPQPVRLGDRHRHRQEAGQGALGLHPAQHGRDGLADRVREGGADVRQAAEAEAGRGHGGPDRLSRRGGQQGAGEAGRLRRGPRGRRLDLHPHRRQEAPAGAGEGGRRPAESKLDREGNKVDATVQAGATSVDPKTGKVVALYGGEDYIKHYISNATRQDYQPASTFVAARARLRPGERVGDPGRQPDRAQHRLRRHQQAARRRQRHPVRPCRTRTTAATARSPSRRP